MFGPDFLADRAAKVRGWQKRGVKTGSGKPFDNSLETTIIKPPAFAGGSKSSPFETDIAAPATFEVVNGVDSLPAWLVEIIKNDPDIARGMSKRSKFKPESPHKVALIDAAKNPNLLSKSPEHYIQVRLFYWLERYHPDVYELTKAIPNGGLRSKKTAFDMKAEGQKAGSPDMDIEVARGAYFGMKLEVKTESGVLSAHQKGKITLYRANRFYVEVGKGYEACKSLIENYLSLPPFDNMTMLD